MQEQNASISRKSIRIYTSGEIMKWPPMKWLIKPILPDGGLGVLYSAPGQGKTFVALGIGAAVALNRDWIDKHPTKTGPVLYIFAEGRMGLQNRIAALIKYHQKDMPDNFKFIPQSINFHEQSDFEDLCAAINTLDEPPALIIIDTMARCLSGGDDNSAKEISEFIGKLDKIREGTGAFILVIHHTRKDNKDMRGSSALKGAADVTLYLEKDRNGIIKLICTKQKDAEEFIPIYLRQEKILLDIQCRALPF